MFEFISFVVMTKEGMIEPKLQKDRDKRQRDGKQRQNSESAGRQLAGIDRHQNETERTVDQAADSEDQRMLNCLFDLVVYRGCCSAVA